MQATAQLRLGGECEIVVGWAAVVWWEGCRGGGGREDGVGGRRLHMRRRERLEIDSNGSD